MSSSRSFLLLAACLLGLGCPGGPIDGDRDGAGSQIDCDDNDPTRYPGAEEIADDGVDQDCDGNDAVHCFYDGDGDGYGYATANQYDADGVCDDDPLQAAIPGDCDDSRADINPAMAEILDDGLDQDCSGQDRVTCYRDDDEDGMGSETGVVEAEWPCADAGFSNAAGDCDDADAAVFLGAAEVLDDGIDQDCNGFDSISCFYDGDLDGYGADVFDEAIDGVCDTADNESANNLDCDDSRPDISPAGVEIPDDSADQDCSGADARSCYEDADGDGFGAGPLVVNPAGSCSETPGFSWVNTDCDDGNLGAWPGATDAPGDGLDQDCNGLDAVLCFFDGDLDGFGAVGSAVTDLDGTCLPADMQSLGGGDCDDSDPGVYPAALEFADDGIDQDCNGFDTVSCFEDADTDGFGAASNLDDDGDCTDDVGQSNLGGDCDDTNGVIWPNAPETWDDGVDQDCNGADTVTCYYDGDGDGFGDGASVQGGFDGTCTATALSDTGDDCDDSGATTYPGAPEQCNLVDDDCDSVVDHGDLAAYFQAAGTGRIELPPLVPSTGAITVEAWVLPLDTEWSDAPAVFKHRPGGGSDVWLGAEESGSGRTGRSLMFGFAQDTISGGTTPALTWRHLAATYDGVDHKLYVDGVLVATSQGAGPLSLDPTGGWVLGASLAAGGAPLDYWFGAVDDVRIWSVARTETEIADWRCDQPDPTDADLLGYWPLEGDSLDATPNGNDGTEVGIGGVSYFGR